MWSVIYVNDCSCIIACRLPLWVITRTTVFCEYTVIIMCNSNIMIFYLLVIHDIIISNSNIMLL